MDGPILSFVLPTAQPLLKDDSIDCKAGFDEKSE